jgi:hypothetical protein
MKGKEFGQIGFRSGSNLVTDNLRLGPQQLFTGRYMSPNHSNRVIFAMHGTGTGKTINALSAASLYYLSMFKKLSGSKIIVIGFQKRTFMNEILSKPQLGFITQWEYNKLEKLRKKAEKSGLQNDQQMYKNYRTWLKKQITSPKYGGVLKFFGYKELHNILSSNNELLEYMENSFIICDEIHNVYNSIEQNNYGETLQTIFDHLHSKNVPCKIMLMSATPLNNKPSEIVDLMNLLVPITKRGKPYTKGEFFKDETLLPGAIKRIESIISGYFSFYFNLDPSLMPQMSIVGEPIKYLGKKIDYLKFIKCPYTSEQWKASASVDHSYGTEAYGILDIVFPDGLYTNKHIESISIKPKSWSEKYGIQYTSGTVTGSILKKENIKKWSGKYHKMLCELDEFLQLGNQKLMITHEYVNGTGVRLIAEILQTNGIIEYGSSAARNTRCYRCGVTKHDHGSDHEFGASTYAIIHGEVEPKLIKERINIYNGSRNKTGEIIQILVVSKMVREGYNFKAVRQMWIMHSPPNISSMIQLFGRPVRMRSHVDLPEGDRNVKIKIFVTTRDDRSYMNARYDQKIKEYKVIQQIETVIRKTAIDNNLYAETINRAIRASDFMTGAPITAKPINYKVNDAIFNIQYGDWEIAEIKDIIVNMFYLSKVWKYTDLWKAVRNPPFIMNVDPKSFDEENFVLALYELMYGDDYELKNKYIIIRGIKYRIVYVDGLYILSIVDEKPIERDIGIRVTADSYSIDYNSWGMSIPNFTENRFTITDKLANVYTSYSNMKQKFIETFRDVDFKKIPLSTEIYGDEFHRNLIEDCIKYAFDLYIGIGMKTEDHFFNFKMLHFYKTLDIIVFADEIKGDDYENYTIPSKGGGDRWNNFLISTISNTTSIPSFQIKNIDSFIGKNKKKVPEHILPIGYIYGDDIQFKFYKPSGWYHNDELVEKYICTNENNIIVGLYEKSQSTINYKFKLRPPKQKLVSHEDVRKNIKGIVCNTMKKTELKQIAKALDIDVGGTSKLICNEIKLNLLRRELKERSKFKRGLIKNPVRWIYLAHEKD